MKTAKGGKFEPHLMIHAVTIHSYSADTED